MNLVSLKILLLISLFISVESFAGLQIIKSSHCASTDLFLEWTSLEGFTQTFQKTTANTVPMQVSVNGFVGLKHRGIVYGGTAKYPIGWATIVTLEYSTNPFTPVSTYELRPANLSAGGILDAIEPAKDSGNIYGIDDHYGTGILQGHKQITEPGYYRIRAWGLSHSSVAPTTNGLIEVLAPNCQSMYNRMETRLED